MIAALFVEGPTKRRPEGGCYFGLPDVDPWDEARDARTYKGPHPVVAHPPCARWCRLAGLVEARWGHKRGDDGGCFAAAKTSVEMFGGVLEHPAWSDAWTTFHIPTPPQNRWVGDGDRRTRSPEVWSGMDVPRRAGALWAPSEKGDVVVCGAAVWRLPSDVGVGSEC